MPQDVLFDDASDAAEALPLSGFSLAPLPKTAAYRNLQELLERNGTDASTAAAISRAVCDPALARAQLKSPAPTRVPGATLLTITVDVWAAAVIPYIANPRVAEDWHFPVAGDGSDRHIPLSDVRGVPGAAVLAVQADTPKHVTGELSSAASKLAELNSYRSSISLYGVMRRITLAPLVISHRDGTDTVTILSAVDGSSRVAATHAIHGLDPHVALYSHSTDISALRRTITETLALADLPEGELTEDEQARLRCVRVPAEIIVGLLPDNGTEIDFGVAIRNLLGMMHVEPPKAWGHAGMLDAKADSVLDILHDEGIICATERAWMAGMLDPDAAEAAGLSRHLDERAAHILTVLMHPDHKRSVNQAIQQLAVSTASPSQRDRLAVAAELMMRAVRHRLGADAAHQVRQALQRMWEGGEFVPKFKYESFDWSLSKRTPQELLDEALTEDDVAGGATLELAILGGYWLATSGLIGRPARTSSDTRTPNVILAQLSATPAGLHQLYHAVIAGRAGAPIPEIDPKTGDVVRTARGDLRPLSESQLRSAFPDASTAAATTTQQAEEGLAPTYRLEQTRDELRRSINGSLSSARRVKDIIDPDSDEPLVNRVGIAPDIAAKLQEQLSEINGALLEWSVIWKVRNRSTGSDET